MLNKICVLLFENQKSIPLEKWNEKSEILKTTKIL